MKTLTIEGNRIMDIPSFYEEINRVFMQQESWKLSESLDALNDLLYGGFGAMAHEAEVKLIWNHADISKKALGLETTISYYEKKIARPDLYNAALFKEKLSALIQGAGPTYYEIVKEIIESHPQISLVEN